MGFTMAEKNKIKGCPKNNFSDSPGYTNYITNGELAAGVVGNDFINGFSAGGSNRVGSNGGRSHYIYFYRIRFFDDSRSPLNGSRAYTRSFIRAGNFHFGYPSVY
jgi:hypothetical protein